MANFSLTECSTENIQHFQNKENINSYSIIQPKDFVKSNQRKPVQNLGSH